MMIFYFFRSSLVFAVHVSKNRTASCSFSCSILYPLNITPTLVIFESMLDKIPISFMCANLLSSFVSF